ncbi:hypothetical protein GCM10023185_22800 [Hymenobacter saemangeumensis]|uniref:Glycosyltransferase RgtA/B/C/D-like domain-containing protein n=1 Tax=Hymenobacter saemangeumensis TaxID=1084522 RepID=A0ABP8IG70_9BACT
MSSRGLLSAWPYGRSLGLAAMVQLALFAWATSSGLGGTSDSKQYLHAADTLRSLGYMLHLDGTPYRYWPPLYPLLITACGSLAMLRVVHAACLLGSLWLWSWLGRRLLLPRGAALLPWLLAFSTSWLVVSKFVWGETVFILLFAGYCVALFQWLQTQRTGWMLAATALGVLLPLQRTIGLFLLAGVGAGLLLWAARHWRRLPSVLLHLIISFAGGLAWNYYALLLAASSVYAPNRGWTQLMVSMADYGYVFGRWLLPLLAGWRAAGPAWAWALLLLALLVALWPRHRFKSVATPDHPAGGVTLVVAQPLFVRLLWAGLLGFVVLIMVASIFSRSASGPHDSERYASVLFAPFILLVLRQMQELPGQRMPRLQALLLGLLLAYNMLRAGSNAQALRRTPVLEWQADAALSFPAPHGQRVGAAAQ